MASLGICPMADAVEHILMYLLAIHVRSFMKCLFTSVAHFKSELLDFLLFFPDIGLLSDRWIANIFPRLCGLPFQF